MSNSNIIIRTQYQQCKNLKKSISKTISYITDKRKADSSSIDEYDLLRDYTLFTNNDSYLFEDKEAFAWSIDGDIDAKKDLKEIKNLDESGTLWSLIISFQPDFALNNGLVTKLDYYNLTKGSHSAEFEFLYEHHWEEWYTAYGMSILNYNTIEEAYAQCFEIYIIAPECLDPGTQYFIKQEIDSVKP